MENMFHVTESEMEVLEKLWDQEDGIRQPQLLALFAADGKEWKRQTLNTFLSRLEEKGLVTREKRIVKPRYSRESFVCKEVGAMIDKSFGGQVSDFLAAFKKEHRFTDSDAEAMIRVIKEQ